MQPSRRQRKESIALRRLDWRHSRNVWVSRETGKSLKGLRRAGLNHSAVHAAIALRAEFLRHDSCRQVRQRSLGWPLRFSTTMFDGVIRCPLGQTLNGRPFGNVSAAPAGGAFSPGTCDSRYGIGSSLFQIFERSCQCVGLQQLRPMQFCI